MPKKIISVDEWSRDRAGVVVEEVLKAFGTMGQDNGTTKHLEYHFLAGYIAALVYKSLDSLDKKDTTLTKDKKFQLTQDSFLDCKMNVQEAVSAAFQGAMMTWTGKTVEYYCTVKPVPEMVNKVMN